MTVSDNKKGNKIIFILIFSILLILVLCITSPFAYIYIESDPIKIDRFKDFVAAVSSLVSAAAALVTCAVALYGVSQWKKQLYFSKKMSILWSSKVRTAELRSECDSWIISLYFSTIGDEFRVIHAREAKSKIDTILQKIKIDSIWLDKLYRKEEKFFHNWILRIEVLLNQISKLTEQQIEKRSSDSEFQSYFNPQSKIISDELMRFELELSKLEDMI